MYRRQALLCLLAKNCSEAGYIRLIEALCNEHQIKLLKVSQTFCLVTTHPPNSCVVFNFNLVHSSIDDVSK